MKTAKLGVVTNDTHSYEVTKGNLRIRKLHSFLILFEKHLTPLSPPPFRLNIYVVNFSEGILTKVRERLLQQLSTQ